MLYYDMNVATYLRFVDPLDLLPLLCTLAGCDAGKGNRTCYFIFILSKVISNDSIKENSGRDYTPKHSDETVYSKELQALPCPRLKPD